MIHVAEADLLRLLAAYGYWAVLIFVGVESLGVPFPGESMLVTAAVYAGGTHRLSILGVVAAAAAGAIMGDNIGYAIGHWGGYRLLLRHGHLIRLDHAKLKLGRYIFLRQGGKVVFFGRFVSVLRTYAAFLAGTTRMPWPRFLAFNAAGGIVWSALYGTAGFSLGKELNRVSRPVGLALGAAAVVVILGFAVFLRRNQKRLEEEAERALPGPLVA